MSKRLQFEIEGRLSVLQHEGRSLMHVCNDEFDIMTIGEMLDAAGFNRDEEVGKSVVIYVNEVD